MSTPEVLAILIVFGALLVLGALVLVLRRRRAGKPDAEPLSAEPDDRPLPAVVINPTKFTDLDPVRAEITEVCTTLGWAQPLWLETTADDPGVGQARDAVDRGADVVLACGGDGTVRCVGQALASTGVALGLLPAGTGNLLARNLDMQLDDIAGAVRIALTGDDRWVDVGWVEVGDEPEQAFLVMAGMGFDAAVMAGAPAGLKARVGPFAYVISGLRALKGRQTRIALTVGGGPTSGRRVRTVVVGNCGKLMGGLVLMPAAKIDDGRLDVVTIAPQGIIGWVGVAARVLTRRRRPPTR